MTRVDLEGLDGLADELAQVGASLVGSGLVLGSGGNLSARLPGEERCVITASGTWLDRLTPSAFSIVDLDGRWLAGNPAPSSEFALHVAAYRARPDATAVIHVHPQHAVLIDGLGHQIRLLTTDHLYYVRAVGRVPFLLPGSWELAEASASELETANCVVLANHGCCVVADSTELALKRVQNLEEAATATFRALQLGDHETSGPQAYVEHIARLEAEGSTRH